LHSLSELVLTWESTQYRLPDHTVRINESKESANLGLTGIALPENVPYNERGNDKNAKHANGVYVDQTSTRRYQYLGSYY
jgi:hypothetical protein